VDLVELIEVIAHTDDQLSREGLSRSCITTHVAVASAI